MKNYISFIVKVIVVVIIISNIAWFTYISSWDKLNVFSQAESETPSLEHKPQTLGTQNLDLPSDSSGALSSKESEVITSLNKELEVKENDLLQATKELALLRDQVDALHQHNVELSTDLEHFKEQEATRKSIMRSGIDYRKKTGLIDEMKVVKDQQLKEEYRNSNKTTELQGYKASDSDSDKTLEPTPEKIVILSAYDDDWLEVGTGKHEATAMALANRDEYAQYHGYKHQVLNLTHLRMPDDPPGMSAVWLKMRAINKAYEMNREAEWVWWLDMDAIIMNPYVELAHHILGEKVLSQRLLHNKPLADYSGKVNGLVYYAEDEIDIKDIDLVISQDMYGLNAGSFFLKKSDFTAWFLDMWYDPLYISWGFPRAEQGCLIWLVNNHEAVRKHVGLVSQRLANSYNDPQEKFEPKGKWFTDGDLLIHLAGSSRKYRFNKLWDQYWGQRRLLPEDKRIAPIESTNELISKEDMDLDE